MGNCLATALLKRRNERGFTDIKLLNQTLKARVLSVYDGDTITIGFKTNGGYWKSQVRIYGIDAPELKPRLANRSMESIEKEKALAIKARDRLRILIESKVVKVQVFKTPDKFGRLLATVFTEDSKRTVAQVLLEENLVTPYYGEKKKNFDEQDMQHLKQRASMPGSSASQLGPQSSDYSVEVLLL